MLDVVAREQVGKKLKAMQHALTEAKQHLDREELIACCTRMEDAAALAVFDGDYIKLLTEIDNIT